MDPILVTFFTHNAWASHRLLEVCASLSDAHLDASGVGTYGRLRDTLVHLVAAQGRYVELLTGHPQEVRVHESESFPGCALLRQSADWSGAALVSLAGTVDPATVLRGTRHGRAFTLPVVTPLLQAINHATEHRCHIATILTQEGVEPPPLDGWTYGDDPTR